MKYCSNCGKEINENQDICLNCGHKQTIFRKQENYSNNADTGSFGWSLLGFCIPIVGLILYIVWNKDRPRDAKAAGVGALVAFVASIFLSIMSVILGALASGI